MKYVGSLLRLILAITAARAPGAAASLPDFAKDAMARIFKASTPGRRAPILLLTPQLPNACAEVVKSLEAEARVLTNVYLEDTSNIRSETAAQDVFNSRPSPSPFAIKTAFEAYLDARKFGGIVMFPNAAGDANAIVAARVARIFKEGKHVSAAGHFATARQAFVLQAATGVAVAKRGTLGSAMANSLWHGVINACGYQLVDGEQFAARIAADDAPIEAPAAVPEPTVRAFAEDLVTRIGRASQPLLLPPLVVLTALPGHSCGPVAAAVFDVAQATLPAYNIFPASSADFRYDTFHKFLETERRGLIMVRKSADLGQTQLGTAQVGTFILSQWHDGPKGGFAMDRYSYVLETVPEAELMPNLPIGRLLDRAQVSDTAHGCRYSLFSGLSILTLMKEHKRCQQPLESL